MERRLAGGGKQKGTKGGVTKIGTKGGGRGGGGKKRG